MKRNKIFTALFIIVLAVAAAGLTLLTQPKYFSLLAPPENYGDCVEAGGAIQESYPSRCVFKDLTFTNPDETPEAPATDLKSYADGDYGFSFKYPTDVFKEVRTEQQFPFVSATNLRPVTVLVHEIPVQHCDLSGRPEGCTPTTKDITVAFMPLDMSMADLTSSGQAAGGFKNIDLGTVAAKTATVGVEGEGQVYYLVELPDSKSLLIIRSYINEQVVGSYQNQPGFIKFADQEQAFRDLAATLTLNSSPADKPAAASGTSLAQLAGDTSGWEVFTNNTRGYSIKYPKDWIIEPVNIANNPEHNQPERYLKFTSPDKKYLLTVGIKKNGENVWLGGFLDGQLSGGPFDNSSTLQVAGTTFPMRTARSNGLPPEDSVIYYNDKSVPDGLGTTVGNFIVRAEFVKLSTTDKNSLEQAPELKIANSILSSLVLK